MTKMTDGDDRMDLQRVSTDTTNYLAKLVQLENKYSQYDHES